MLDMADRHKTKPFLIRIPDDHRSALEEAAKRNRRTMTEEVKLAMEMYFESIGLWPWPPPTEKKGKK